MGACWALGALFVTVVLVVVIWRSLDSRTLCIRKRYLRTLHDRLPMDEEPAFVKQLIGAAFDIDPKKLHNSDALSSFAAGTAFGIDGDGPEWGTVEGVLEKILPPNIELNAVVTIGDLQDLVDRVRVCGECGYSLIGHGRAGTCSECGRDFGFDPVGITTLRNDDDNR